MKRLALCLLKNPTALLDPNTIPPGWELKFAADRDGALQTLAMTPFEGVVTDDSWQNGDQPDFFVDVALHCPEIARVRLFDPLNKGAVGGQDVVADQLVPRPCKAESLVCAIRRGKLLRKWLTQSALLQLLPRIRKMPSVPPLYSRLVQMLESGNPNVEEIGEIVREDFAMTAKLLQLVNSPFFGLKRTINDAAEAVAHLGLVQTKALVLLAQIFFSYSADEASRFSLDQLWKHSTATAKLAKAITEFETEDTAQADAAFTAGLLHDVGKLFHAVNCPQEYNTLLEQAARNGVTYVEAERCLLGTTHAELGACVLATWGLPADTLEAIAFHHHPPEYLGNTFGPMTAVHVANAFDYELNVGERASPEAAQVDYEYLKWVGCEERVFIWREHCLGEPMRIAA